MVASLYPLQDLRINIQVTRMMKHYKETIENYKGRKEINEDRK